MQFVDLPRQFQRYRAEILEAVEGVLDSASFINGPAVSELEKELAKRIGVKHAIGCSSGTDAIILSLMALDLQPQDEVVVPDFSFFATAEAVALLGATPVFVDIDPHTYNIDPAAISKAVTDRTVGIIPVSLYGQVVEMDEILDIADRRGLWVVEDGAQSFGALYKSRPSCSLTRVATTSFFPAKPLGAYGDAGAVFTDDDSLAERLRMILNHGQRSRYDHHRIGLNARLDSLQAAVLKVKLRHFDEEKRVRHEIAEEYTRRLDGLVTTPAVREYNYSVWAQYTVRVPNRFEVQNRMKESGVPTSVHYPAPLHKQKAFAGLSTSQTENPHADRAAQEVLSLPMHPFLSLQEVEVVCAALESALMGTSHGR